jgi:hypothetical protein
MACVLSGALCLGPSLEGMTLSGRMGLVMAGVAVALGAAFCFFGFRVFRYVLAAAGAFVGASLGAELGAGIFGQVPWLIITCAAICGIMLGFLGAAVYFLGVFLVGGIAGFTVGAALGFLILPIFPILSIVFGVAFGAVGGVLAIILQKPIIVIGTALVGASWVTTGGALLFGGESVSRTLEEGINLYARMLPEDLSALHFVVWLALAIAGAIIQFALTAKGEFHKHHIRIERHNNGDDKSESNNKV